MANKKMCKYHEKNRRNWYGGNCFKPDSAEDCPKYTGKKCEIIPKPKKRNAVTVKGWAEIVGKNRLIAFSFKPSGKVFPCTITYKVDGNKGRK